MCERQKKKRTISWRNNNCILSTDDLFIYVWRRCCVWVGGFAMFLFLSMYYNQMSLLYYNRKCNGIQITLLICIIPIPLSSSAGCLQREKTEKGRRWVQGVAQCYTGCCHSPLCYQCSPIPLAHIHHCWNKERKNDRMRRSRYSSCCTFQIGSSGKSHTLPFGIQGGNTTTMMMMMMLDHCYAMQCFLQQQQLIPHCHLVTWTSPNSQTVGLLDVGASTSL